MKRGRVLAFAAVLLCLLGVFTCPVGAFPSFSDDTAQNAEQEASEALLSDFFDLLPDLAKEGLASDVRDTESLRDAVGFARIFTLLGNSFSGAFSEDKGVFLQMLGLTLLFCAVGLVGGFFSRYPFARMFVEAAAALSLYRLLFGTAERVFAAIGELSAFSMGLSGLYAALFSAGGAAASAAAASGGFVLFTGILEGLVAGMLLPLLRVLFALVLLSSFASGGAAEGIGGRIRAVYIWMLSLISVLFTASLATQSSIAAGTDTVAFRTVKFAVGGSIPLVGGTVSSVLGSLQASLSLIKSAFGAGSLIALLSLLLPVFAELLLLRAAISVCSFVCECFGGGMMEKVLARYRAVLDFMLATVAIVAVLFFILLAIVGKTFSF